jgi:hypothetical protein
MTFGISASTLFTGAATLAGGLMSASASSSAADAQTAAANQANATQLDIFNQQKAMSAPYRTGGAAAQNRLMTLLGINPMDAATYGTANPNYGMTDAATGVNTTDQYIMPQGVNVNAASPDFGKYARDFGMQDFTADPGYAFRLSEGMKGLNAQAAARGGLISGAALKAATNYGQQAGSQEYQNAYNRYQTNRTNQLAPLQSLTASGQAAAAGAAANAGAYGSAAASNTLAAGNAAASGIMGGSNAINSTIGSIGNQFTSAQNAANQTSYQNQVLSALNGGGGGNSALTQSLLNNPFG